MNAIICPGCQNSVEDAKELFGESRVVSEFWRGPISINNLSEDEAGFAKEYFEGLRKKVTIET